MLRTTAFFAVLPLCFSAACGESEGNGKSDAKSPTDDSGAIDDAAVNDAAPLAFVLQSTAYIEGGVIPDLHSCQGPSQEGLSPALTWANPPAEAKAFGLIFIDQSTSFLHSAMWDIPVARTKLPEGTDTNFESTDVPGAKQPRSYTKTRGYAGPCPQVEHTYRFELHAVDVAELPGLNQGSTRQEVVTAIEAASLGSAKLTGTFDPNS